MHDVHVMHITHVMHVMHVMHVNVWFYVDMYECTNVCVYGVYFLLTGSTPVITICEGK